MSQIVWQIEHTIEADVSAPFAWNFWSNVSNWEEPPNEFVLEGPFAEGSVGITRMPGQDPIRWRIRDVVPGAGATIDIELDRATVAFRWRFEAMSDRRTKLVQRITLEGENAAAYVGHLDAAFGTLPEGMKRLAAAMTRSASDSIAQIAGHLP
jgi:hypothetical protein